jgi:hypothetical protein
MASKTEAMAHDVPTNPAVGRLAAGWLLVGVPLLYGIFQTLTRVAQLFQ